MQKSTLQSRQGIGSYMDMPAVREQITRVVGGQNGDRFVASIVASVTATPAIKDCDPGTIVSAALVGHALNLSPSPQLGQFYMVPYKDKRSSMSKAQFQLGYRGYIQLAIRSGYYKRINVLPIKEGELVKFDALTEEIQVELIEDEEVREDAPTIGYYAMFEYLNGFKKAMYWSRKKMESHARKYSQGYASDLRNKTSYTFWSKNFDDMAMKTMIRQLISRWGIMSIDLQKAYESDHAVITDDGTPQYVDYGETEVQEEKQAQVVDDVKAATPEVEAAESELPFTVGDNDRNLDPEVEQLFFGEAQ